MSTPLVPSRRVVAIRNALGVTQEKLAALLGVTVTSVSRWESGTSAPTGLPLRLLVMLEGAAHNRDFVAQLRNPRSSDPLYVLYRLLELSYDEDK